jgi:hypothetical protein
MRAILTNDSDMGNPGSNVREYSLLELENYLNANPRNAVVVSHRSGQQVAVFRGAGEDLNNFFIQSLPLEDPGDADGGDWSAKVALTTVL